MIIRYRPPAAARRIANCRRGDGGPYNRTIIRFHA